MRVRPEGSAARRPMAVGVLAALAVALPSGPARAEPGGCRLVITATPRTLGAGQASAQLFVFGAVRVPRLVASAGAVEDLRREGGETFAARFVPPRDGLARVAVIGAVIDEGSCGLVSVRLADPPGASRRPAPPLAAPVAAVILPPTALPDGDVEARAFVFAVDDAGEPRAGPPPQVAVGAGTASPAEPVCPGVWTLRWRAPGQRVADQLLTATFPGGAAGSARFTTRLSALEVQLDPPRAIRGASEPVAVIVRGWDEAHRPADADLTLTATAGTLSKPERVEPGVYLAGLLVPPGEQGAGEVSVRARAGPILGEASLHFAAGEASVLAIDGPEALVCDGTPAMLVLTVTDAQGNPVDGAAPQVEALQADLAPPHHAAAGQWWVSYRPRCTAEPSSDLVVARAGPAVGHRAIFLSAPASGVAVGAKAGLAAQAGGAAFSASAEVAGWTRLGGHQVGLALEVGRWVVGSRGRLDGLGEYADERAYLPVLLSAAWQRPLRGQVVLAAAAGAGAAQVATTNRLAAQPDVHASGWAPALTGAVSLGRWATHGTAFVEARGTWIGDPRLATLRGALTSFLLQAGYRFHGW